MEATLFALLMFIAVLMIVGSLVLGQQLDPVQARLQQIAVRPRSLEELELQRPLSERTLKPIINSLSRLVGRFYPKNTVRGLALKLKPPKWCKLASISFSGPMTGTSAAISSAAKSCSSWICASLQRSGR